MLVTSSTHLIKLPFATRQKLTYEVGGHFTPMANSLVADEMAEFLSEQRLVRFPSEGKASLSAKPVSKTGDKRYVLGVSCFYHNSSAALICDGKLVAAADEERFTRVKNDRRFPQLAINYCLEEAGISAGELAAVCIL